MAWTARKGDEVTEHFDDPEVVERKATLIANLIRSARHFIAFTGAGVSTSAGIPDFRGPEGAWTLAAEGRTRTTPTTSTLKAVPTKTHMALLALMQAGLLKYLVSQNTDGLHRRSGIPPDKISELHGNSNREYCGRCGREFLRDYRATASYRTSVHDHVTGRKCDKCGGDLLDSIINFGEPLPTEPLRKAFDNAEEADLCLVLGSSCTVSPACDIPRMVGQKSDGNLAICNLQVTPLDPLASIRIFAQTDHLMTAVMSKLGLEIPPFVLHRRLLVRQEQVEGKDNTITKVSFGGVDEQGTPASFIKKVEVRVGDQTVVMPNEPFVLSLRTTPTPRDLKAKLYPWGHYNEPTVEVTYSITPEYPSQTLYHLDYNPQTGHWDVHGD